MATGSENSGPLSVTMMAKSLLKSSGPAASQSLPKISVHAAESFESLMKPSARSSSLKMNVKMYLPSLFCPSSPSISASRSRSEGLAIQYEIRSL